MATNKVPHLNRWDVDKFWNNNNFIYRPETGCLEWQRGLGIHGYGRISINGISIATHRLAYFIYYQEDPGELLVRHTCHNRLCSHPLHLTLGTHWDNSQDMVLAGRSQTGERHWSKRMPERLEEMREVYRANGRRMAAELNGENHPTTVLTADIVRAIKKRSLDGVGNKILAQEFNVTHSNISAILLGKSWTHIECEMRGKDTKFAPKMTEDDVRQIRQQFAQGYSSAALARAWGLSDSAMGQITRGESWKHVI